MAPHCAHADTAETRFSLGRYSLDPVDFGCLVGCLAALISFDVLSGLRIGFEPSDGLQPSLKSNSRWHGPPPPGGCPPRMADPGWARGARMPVRLPQDGTSEPLAIDYRPVASLCAQCPHYSVTLILCSPRVGFEAAAEVYGGKWVWHPAASAGLPGRAPARVSPGCSAREWPWYSRTTGRTRADPPQQYRTLYVSLNVLVSPVRRTRSHSGKS